MRYPLKMSAKMAGYIAGKKIQRTKKFPMVLMLEPLHACNLTCTGCGRIREYKSTINESLTVAECWRRWMIADRQLFRFAAASR